MRKRRTPHLLHYQLMIKRMKLEPPNADARAHIMERGRRSRAEALLRETRKDLADALRFCLAVRAGETTVIRISTTWEAPSRRLKVVSTMAASLVLRTTKRGFSPVAGVVVELP